MPSSGVSAQFQIVTKNCRPQHPRDPFPVPTVATPPVPPPAFLEEDGTCAEELPLSTATGLLSG